MNNNSSALEQNEYGNRGDHLELGGESVLTEDGKALVSFLTNEEMASRGVQGDQTPKIDCPYPDQTPRAILERWRVLDTISLGGSGSFQQNVVAQLMAVPAIKAALSTFRFFRSEIEVKIQISSVPQQYGTIFVTSAPWVDITDPSLGFSDSTVLSHDVAAIDVSNQQELVLRIPMILMENFLDLNHVTTWINKVIHLFFYLPMSIRSLDAGISTTVSMVLSARFVDPVCCLNIVENTSTMVAQSYQRAATASALLATGIGMVSQISTGLDMTANIGKSVNGALNELSETFSFFSQEKKDEVLPLKQTPYSDLSHPFTSVDLGESNVKVDGKYGDDDQSHSLLGILKKPSLVLFNDVDVSVSTIPITWKADTRYSATMGTRIGFYSQFFRMWRGSFRYHVRIVTSPLYSFRTTLKLDFATQAGIAEVPLDVITVRGTTSFDIEVPYCRLTPWSPTITDPGVPSSVPDFAPTIVLQVINTSPFAGSTTPHAQVIVWEYAGDDFEFSSICNVVGPYTTPVLGNSTVLKKKNTNKREKPKMVAQSYIRDEVGKTVFKVGQGTPVKFATGKTRVQTIEQLLERFSFRDPVQGSSLPGLLGKVGSFNWMDVGNFDMLVSQFLFYSGGVKFKVRTNELGDLTAYIDSGARTQSVYTPLDGFSSVRPDNGMAKVVAALNPVLDFEMPFVCTTEVLPTARFVSQVPLSVDVNPFLTFFEQETDTGTTELHSVFIAGGKGFRLYSDFPPVRQDLWPYFAQNTA